METLRKLFAWSIMACWSERKRVKLQPLHWVTYEMLFVFLCLGVSHCHAETAAPTVLTLRMGIVMNKDTGYVSDYNILGPAIDLAVHRIKHDLELTIEPFLCLYVSNCSEASGLPSLRQVVRALNNAVDFMLGPACTPDLIMAAKLTTVYGIPLMTGAGSLVDKTREWRYVTRTGYNGATQWKFFGSILRQFGWKNVVVYYESDSTAYVINGQGTYALVSLMNIFNHETLMEAQKNHLLANLKWVHVGESPKDLFGSISPAL